MKALMTSAALAAFLAAVPALADDAKPPMTTDQPAATDTQPDAMDPGANPSAEAPAALPDANAPTSAETTPPAGDTAAPPAAAATTPDSTAPTTAAVPTGEKFLTTQDQGEVLASKVIGSTVYGAGDENLGDINDVILAKEGGVDAVVIGVGGFLGIGEKNVAVAFDQIEPTTDADGNVKLVLRVSKEELDAAPEYMTLADLAAKEPVPAPATQ